MTNKTFFSRDPAVISERILDAAEAVFVEDGFAAASTNRILAKFGGSKATLFRHFPTKGALFEGVICRVGSRMLAGIDWQRLAIETPLGWLTIFGEMALAAFLHDDALFFGRMVVAQGHNFPVLRDTFVATALEPMHAALADRFQSWTRQGLLTCKEPEADAILYLDILVNGWVTRALFGVGLERTEAFFKRESSRAALLFLNGRRLRE